jgi:hypothetical protein
MGLRYMYKGCSNETLPYTPVGQRCQGRDSAVVPTAAQVSLHRLSASIGFLLQLPWGLP